MQKSSSRGGWSKQATIEVGFRNHLEHKNKDVRLCAASALADTLRIYAPDPPYVEECNADVIKFFIKILGGFQSPNMTPQHPSYRLVPVGCVC